MASPVTPTTLDPANKGAEATLTNGNLTVTTNNTAAVKSIASVSSGKWYWECTLAYTSMSAIANSAAKIDGWFTYPGQDLNSWAFYAHDGSTLRNGANPLLGCGGFPSGSPGTVGMVLDMDAGTLNFKVNGVVYTGFTGITGPVFAFVGSAGGGTNGWQYGYGGTVNFGATPFVQSVPVGYAAGFGTLASSLSSISIALDDASASLPTQVSPLTSVSITLADSTASVSAATSVQTSVTVTLGDSSASLTASVSPLTSVTVTLADAAASVDASVSPLTSVVISLEDAVFSGSSEPQALSATAFSVNLDDAMATVLASVSPLAMMAVYTDDVAANLNAAVLTAGVYPTPAQVALGVSYGPTGAEYVGTLVGGSGATAADIALAVWAHASRGLTTPVGLTAGENTKLMSLSTDNLDVPVSTRLATAAYSQVASIDNAAVALAVRTELAIELARIDADISSRLADTGYFAAPTAAQNADAVWAKTLP